MSHIIIVTIPVKTPKRILKFDDFSLASGRSSKHITASINPEARANTKLRNLLDIFFMDTPINPPRKVPIVPKNKPVAVEKNIFKNVTSILCILKKLNYMNMVELIIWA